MAEASEKHVKEMDQLRLEHKDASEKHEKEIGELQVRHMEERTALTQETSDRHVKEMADLTRQHKRETASITARNAKLQRAIQKNHNREKQSLRATHQVALRALKKDHRDRMIDRDIEIKRLTEAHKKEIKEVAERMEKHRAEASQYLQENLRLRKSNADLKDQFDIKQRERKRHLQSIQAAALAKRDVRLKKFQSLVLELKEKLIELGQSSKNEMKKLKKKAKTATELESKMSQRAESRKMDAKKWKEKYVEAERALVTNDEEADELREQIDEWKNIANDLEQQYYDAIHNLTPECIRKVWVKNEGKKGKYDWQQCEHKMTSMS